MPLHASGVRLELVKTKEVIVPEFAVCRPLSSAVDVWVSSVDENLNGEPSKGDGCVAR